MQAEQHAAGTKQHLHSTDDADSIFLFPSMLPYQADDEAESSSGGNQENQRSRSNKCKLASRPKAQPCRRQQHATATSPTSSKVTGTKRPRSARTYYDSDSSDDDDDDDDDQHYRTTKRQSLSRQFQELSNSIGATNRRKASATLSAAAVDDDDAPPPSPPSKPPSLSRQFAELTQGTRTRSRSPRAPSARETPKWNTAPPSSDSDSDSEGYTRKHQQSPSKSRSRPFDAYGLVHMPQANKKMSLSSVFRMIANDSPNKRQKLA
jgi:hypothetical protein